MSYEGQSKWKKQKRKQYDGESPRDTTPSASRVYESVQDSRRACLPAPSGHKSGPAKPGDTKATAKTEARPTLREVNKCVIPREQLKVPEYVFKITLERDPTKNRYQYAGEIPILVSALLNTSGGIIELQPSGNGTSLDHHLLEKWGNNLNGRIKFMTPTDFQQCVTVDANKYRLVVTTSANFTTSDAHLYERVSVAQTANVHHFHGIKNILEQREVERYGKNEPNIREQYQCGELFSEKEGVSLEFKHYTCATITHLMERLSEDLRLHNALFAMANLKTGGNVIIGVTDQERQVLGQEVDTNDDSQILNSIDQLIKHHPENHTFTRIWGDMENVPQRGVHWDCKFIPVIHTDQCCSSKMKRNVLIDIHIFHCPGGVFARRPDAFIISDDGFVEELSFKEWRKRHTTNMVKHTREVSPRTTGQDISKESNPTDDVHTNVVNDDNVHRGAYQGPDSMQLESPEECTFQDSTTLSFKQNSSFWNGKAVQPHTSSASQIMQPDESNLCKTGWPVRYYPDREKVCKLLNDGSRVLQTIDVITAEKACGIAIESLQICIMHGEHDHNISSLSSHKLDIVVLNEKAVMFLFVVWSCLVPECKSYTFATARILKKRLLAAIEDKSSISSFYIQCVNITLDGQNDRADGDASQCDWVQGSISTMPLTVIQAAVRNVLKQVPFFSDTIAYEDDLQLSKHQLDAWLFKDNKAVNRFNIIEGPPGCGKTLLGRHICKTTGKQHSAYISASEALINQVAYGDEIEAFFAVTGGDIVKLLSERLENKTYIVIDDGSNITFTQEDCEKICAHVARGRYLYYFQDSHYQNYHQPENWKPPFETFIHENRRTYGSLCYRHMTEIQRNTKVVGSYIKCHVNLMNPEGDEVQCVSQVQGEDIFIKDIKNLRTEDRNNGLLQHVRGIVSREASPRYELKDIAILIDNKFTEKATEEVKMFRNVFRNYWPGCIPQEAKVVPVSDVTIDLLEHFWGLESKVVIFIFAEDGNNHLAFRDPRYKISIVSRAKERVDFLQQENLDTSITGQLMFDVAPREAITQENTNDKQSAVENRETTGLPHTIKTLRQISALNTSSCIDVTGTGEIFCCTRSSGVVRYSLWTGMGKKFHQPPPDLEPWGIAVNRRTGDTIVAYTSLTTGSVPLYLHDKASNTCTLKHEISKGSLPRVSWTKDDNILVVLKIGREWYLLWFNMREKKEVWRKTTGLETLLSDMFMDDEDNIYCCHMLGDPVRVYTRDGTFSREISFKQPSRDLREPVSISIDETGVILTAQVEKIDGETTVSVLMWDREGQYQKDVLVGLQDPSWPYYFVRLHNSRVMVILIDHKIGIYDVSKCINQNADV